MLRTIQRTLALATVVGATPLIMLATPAAAQSVTPVATDQAATQTLPQPATTQAEAGAPIADWVAIGPHEGHWYKFKYQSNHTDDPSQALVRLKMSPADSVRFEVWTPGRLAAPPRDFSKDDQGTVKIGEEKIKESNGTLRLEDVYDGNVITWAGSSTASDTYYIFVKNTTDKPASYLLTVRGPDVSY